MKHRGILLESIGLMLFMLMSVACTDGTKQSAKGEEQSQATLCKQSATSGDNTPNMKAKAKTSDTEVESDSFLVSLASGRKWTFDYTSPSFPCDTASDCVIKGFAVDGDQTFYILSGNPICISRYDGTRMVNSMQLGHSLDDSYNALLHVTSDTIYYIDEQAKTLYVIDKESLQPTSAYALPIGEEDSVAYGKMSDDSYFLLTMKRNTECWRDENQSVWHFEYPNVVLKRYPGEYSLDSLFWDGVTLREPQEFFLYYGEMRGYRVFLNYPEYDNCSVILADSVGNCVYRDDIKGLPPIAAVSGYEEHIGALQSSNLRTIVGDKLYMTGYDFKKQEFYILEYVLSKLEQSAKSVNADSIVYYLYDYPDSECEDNIIGLCYREGQIVDGYFWGTSDEFSDSREGFYPGFCVLKMEQIICQGADLNFVLDSRNQGYFSGPVDVNVHSSDEALRQGYGLWCQNHEFFQDSIGYCATFEDDALILHKEKSKFAYCSNHRFVKISLDSLKKLTRYCDFEKENRR